jgi:protein SCO1/2
MPSVRWRSRAHVCLTLVALIGVGTDVAALTDQTVPAAETAPAVPLPPGVADVGIDEHLGAALPLHLLFRDHRGESVHLSDYFDSRRPVLVTLVYHRCPMLCSLVLDAVVRGLAAVQWTVGKQFEIVTISIDPEDTPDVATRKRTEVLERYGRPEAEQGWHFLTGKKAEIAGVADALGFRFRWDAEQQQYVHPAVIFLLTPDAKIARYLYGVAYEPRDLRFGLLEASQGREVSTVERILLFCYHYDATGHRYAFVVTRVLRGGGVVLLALVGGLLFFLWRKERRSRPVSTETN